MTKPRPRTLYAFVTAAALAAGILVSPPAQHASGSNLLTIGNVQLGINDEGHLNVPGGMPSAQTGTTTVGLRHAPTNLASTEPGCPCEGWGAADALTGTRGWANQDDGGTFGMQLVSSALTPGVSFVSVVDIPNSTAPVLRVTHDYHASASPDLIECEIAMVNLSSNPIDLRYRRVMDWDAEPTAFDEYVTIQGTAAAANVLFASNDGFQTSDPLGPQTNLGFTGDFVDAFPVTNIGGVHDHGALFDFGFGMLAPNATQRFKIFYGASATEAGALAALAVVGAEVYSFGQNSTPTGHTVGDPATFIFAFAGVGGVPIGFDKCIQDDRTHNVLQWSSTTGDWKFTWCDTGETATGTGTVRNEGCSSFLTDTSAGHHVVGNYRCTRDKGDGRVVTPEFPGMTFRIADRSLSDDTCSCAGDPGKTGAWSKSPRVSYPPQDCPDR